MINCNDRGYLPLGPSTPLTLSKAARDEFTEETLGNSIARFGGKPKTPVIFIERNFH